MGHAGSRHGDVDQEDGLRPAHPVAGLLCAAPAGAADFHPFEYELDGTGTTAGKFSRIEDVAVHQSDGTIYVLDRKNHSIDKFGADGKPAELLGERQIVHRSVR